VRASPWEKVSTLISWCAPMSMKIFLSGLHSPAFCRGSSGVSPALMAPATMGEIVPKTEGYCWRTPKSRKFHPVCNFFKQRALGKSNAERSVLGHYNRFANSIRRFLGHCTYMPKSNKPVTRGNKLI